MQTIHRMLGKVRFLQFLAMFLRNMRYGRALRARFLFPDSSRSRLLLRPGDVCARYGFAGAGGNGAGAGVGFRGSGSSMTLTPVMKWPVSPKQLVGMPTCSS